jgi:hypothetical protein
VLYDVPDGQTIIGHKGKIYEKGLWKNLTFKK